MRIASSQNPYPPLSSLLNEDKPAPIRVCIVTPDLLGPVKNGGIGTACSYLGYALAEAGNDVTILFTSLEVEDGPHAWRGQYGKKGIKVVVAAELANLKEIAIFPNHPPLAMSKIANDWLRAQEKFDLILFMEWQGCGFYPLHAKACGLAYDNTAMVVVTHSPSIWHSLNNASFAANPIESVTWNMERKSLEMADAVISPSAYMLDWHVKHHIKLPDCLFVQPNILKIGSQSGKAPNSPVDEIVFYGRLEYRKGLEQFCAAMDMLARENALPSKVAFLGKAGWMGGEHSVLYIGRHAKKWRCEIKIKLNYDHDQAMAYMAAPGRLAVIPSVADNSPYTVYECLAARIPFLARDVGGVAELIRRGDREHVLFGDKPRDLANKIAKAVGKKPRIASLAFDLEENTAIWKAGLPNLASNLRKDKRKPLISVCLTHYNRPALLRQAVESMLAQDYQDFELLLGDDGSPGIESKEYVDSLEPVFKSRGWRIFRLENGYPGRARNILAKMAKGKWLLFFDDDNIAMPHMLKKCAQAAARKKDGVISLMFNVFDGEGKPDETNRQESFLPVGDTLAYSAINNIIADTTCLVNRDSFVKIGGFTEDYGVGHEDFELLLRFVIAGENIGILPEPLFWYRRTKNKTSVQLNTNEEANRMRSCRPFMEMLPAREAELALMTVGMGLARREIEEEEEDKGPRRKDGLDPQSGECLEQAADILFDNDQDDLAWQILDSINEAGGNYSAEAAKIFRESLDALKDGKLTSLEKKLRDIESADIEKRQKSALYAKIIKMLPEEEKKIRLYLLKKLISWDIKTIENYLLIAAESYKADNGEDAITYFIKALDLAEKEYLEHRKDVAEAVKNGDFVGALHHYALHGEKDKMKWPKDRLFRDALETLAPVEGEIKNAGKLYYKCENDVIVTQMLNNFITKKKIKNG